MSRAQLSFQARRDLDEIFDYIYLDRPSSAYRQIDRLKQTLQLLAEQPLLGQLRDDLRPNLRAFSARRYVILYYPREFGIEVVTILHGARDIEGMFERGER